MTIHVLIPCSKSKNLPPGEDLTWPSTNGIEGWRQVWMNTNSKVEAKELYIGQTTKKQLQICAVNEKVECYVISAGGGLIPATGRMIPSYEATFGKGTGPSPEEWPLLPEGGLENINLGKNDTIVTFAPPNYQRVLARDPLFEEYKAHLIVASNSPLAQQAGAVHRVHERSKEVLKASSRDANSKLLQIFLEEGASGLKNIYSQCLVLPIKASRRKVTDEELSREITKVPNEIKRSITKTVDYIRNNRGISAIDTRIRRALLEDRE